MDPDSQKQRKKLRELPPKNPDHPNLYASGVKGNRGGGNIKSEIRDLSLVSHRKLLKKLIVKADARAENNKLSDSDLLRLLDLTGKYGIGVKTEIEIENGHFARLVIQTAYEFIPTEQWSLFDARVKQVLGGDT